MVISSRTPEGDPNHCHVCGHDMRMEASRPAGDAPCPACGSLVWFSATYEPCKTEENQPHPHGELVPVDGEPGEPIELSRAPLVIGRKPVCDIQVQSPKASAVHCVLSFDGHWTIRDLKSTNGTFVNGQKVSTAVLAPGDKISIGRARYTINYTPAVGSDAAMA
jgi:hypothetical protein